MGAAVLLAVTALAVSVTVVLVVVSILLSSQSKRWIRTMPDPRLCLRLFSRLLFTRRHRDAFTLDCLLVAVDEAVPAIGVPPGFPFTVQLRAPGSALSLQRTDRLLREWAGDGRELLFELREDGGRLRTTIASGESSVDLELAGVGGLQFSR